MFIVSANGQKALRVVHVGSTSHNSDKEIIDFALESQNETRASLFGIDIERYPGGAIVNLWRD